METKAIKEAIASALSSIENIGPVYPYMISPKTPKEFKDLCKNKDHLEWWQVYRSGIGDTVYDSNIKRRIEFFSIMGFYSYGHDNSGKSADSFDSIVNEVFEEVASSGSFDGVVAQISSVDSPTIDLVSIGDVLCHRCIINITVVEYSS
ncbi:MAG: hypothetical protein GY861_22650 [bacterium]|nr:hypothetical protein [bacterium]